MDQLIFLTWLFFFVWRAFKKDIILLRYSFFYLINHILDNEVFFIILLWGFFTRRDFFLFWYWFRLYKFFNYLDWEIYIHIFLFLLNHSNLLQLYRFVVDVLFLWSFELLWDIHLYLWICKIKLYHSFFFFLLMLVLKRGNLSIFIYFFLVWKKIQNTYNFLNKVCIYIFFNDSIYIKKNRIGCFLSKWNIKIISHY